MNFSIPVTDAHLQYLEVIDRHIKFPFTSTRVSDPFIIAAALSLVPLCYRIFYIFLYQYLYLHDKPPNGLKLLPGPVSTIPFLGRLHGIDPVAPWKSMQKYSARYNKIFRMTAYGTMHIWVGDAEIAKELFVHRAAKYSSRPPFPAIPNSDRGGRYLPLERTDEHWRLQRRFAHTVFVDAHATNYYGAIKPEVIRFLYQLLENPTSHFTQTEDFTSRVSARLSYGSASDAHRHSRNANEFIPQLSPTASGPLTNILPFLAHFPEWLNKSRREVRLRQEREMELWIYELERVKQQVQDGTATVPSFARTYFERQISQRSDFKLPEWEAACAVGMLCTMSIFTISGPLYTFFLTMTLHPEWQQKVYEELQQVTGNSRIVELSDRPHLPVLRACIKECFRWKPPVPLGVPRLVTEDDEYNGYFIPKGSIVHVVEEILSQDPELYPEPDKYNPARWLEPEYPTFQEPLTVHPRLMGFSGFGMGRRACVGVELTEAELLVACGSLVSYFELRPNVSAATGELMWPDRENRNSNVIGGPKHFDFDLRIRESKAAELRQMFAEVEAEL